MGAEGYTAAELAGLPGMPPSERHVRLRAAREGWPFLERCQNGGRAKLYPAEALPATTREALALRWTPEAVHVEAAVLGSELADRFTRATPGNREAAVRRVRAVRALHALVDTGTRRADALALVAAEEGESTRTIQRWDAAVRGRPEADWAALLLPKYQGRTDLERVHPEAWNWLLSDYLRPARPAFSACYRRLVELAPVRGWEPIPSVWSLQRRLEREVPASTVAFRREGQKAYERMLPSQRRDKSTLGALGWVNADGHKLDVFAAWPTTDGRTRVARPILVAWQDIYSGKILGWRLDETENADAVRLAFADMLRDYGIPERATVDNGHAFAGKEMTGGQAGRHRFGAGDEGELDGLYKAFGIEAHFARPYHGQAKPIERAFRDLCEEIARHPDCAGAYTGNSPTAKPDDYGSRAVPIADLAALVAREIARHNARTGRTSAVARGRSFDEVFAASYEDPTRVIRRATEAQIRWLLLPSVALVVSKLESTVTWHGNRYHDAALIELRGERVLVKYDPHDLQAGVWVFRPGQLEPLCRAACIAPVGFGDTDAARRDARAKRAQIRAAREAATTIGTIPARELMTEPEAKPAKSKKVVALRFGRAAPAPARTAPTGPSARERDFLEREFEAFAAETAAG